ncbi:MAG: immunoglobulin-like domain-containing protein [Eubacteriales bacterium]
MSTNPRRVRRTHRPTRTGKRPFARLFPLLLVCCLVVLGATLLSRTVASLQLNGSRNTTLALGEEYREKGVEATFLGQDASDDIQIDSDLDPSKPGTYHITYRWKGFPWTFPVKRTVEVKDITIPDLQLQGEALTILTKGDTYTEPGWTAIDNYDGDLSSQVQVAGTVDTQTMADYTLTYTVTDQAGNQATATRTVRVTTVSPLTMSVKDFNMLPYYQDVILPETSDGGDAYINDTILIGDSISVNAGYYGYYPKENIWAKESVQPENIHTWTLRIGRTGRELLAVDAMAEFQPKRVIINLGSNSISWMTPEYFTEQYEALVVKMKAASPNTEIIISSVYPVEKRYDDPERSKTSTSNAKANTANCYLADMCRRQNVKFLNVAEILKDENGQGRADLLYEKDGIHPRAETYEQIVQYIRTHRATD